MDIDGRMDSSPPTYDYSLATKWRSQLFAYLLYCYLTSYSTHLSACKVPNKVIGRRINFVSGRFLSFIQGLLAVVDKRRLLGLALPCSQFPSF